MMEKIEAEKIYTRGKAAVVKALSLQQEENKKQAAEIKKLQNQIKSLEQAITKALPRFRRIHQLRINRLPPISLNRQKKKRILMIPRKRIKLELNRDTPSMSENCFLVKR